MSCGDLGHGDLLHPNVIYEAVTHDRARRLLVGPHPGVRKS